VVVTNPGQAPFAIGFSLMAIVFAFGYFSGGHFNPAVTFGVWLIGGMERKKAITYAAVQFLGGVLGSFYAVMVHGELDNGFIAPIPRERTTFGILRAIAAEVLITFFLVTVVLQVPHFISLAPISCLLPPTFTAHSSQLQPLIIRLRARGKRRINFMVLPSV